MDKPDKQKRPPKTKAAEKPAVAKTTAASPGKSKAATPAATSAPVTARKTRAASVAGKPKAKAVSELDALRAENAELKAKLAAAEGRVAHLLSLTQDVTAKLDDAIALIRGLVRP